MNKKINNNLIMSKKCLKFPKLLNNHYKRHILLLILIKISMILFILWMTILIQKICGMLPFYLL